ncbi:ABC transporter substrate-binding protein [Aurantiacibacter aquimixticola]|uniref:Peptide ABC transporter substrate-binding protein n=1 Tax=Aurantiacibacter aquimixticola TaxID=1958945 RepID=A0A419RV92_9SPHN|nr:ABC transporter substrate-binding protein [Aurantiacibacter aquimixticola]RJY09708.1 peptide ABC transporter substrate-binding protein [Aurantiacibacter aquimixticola]
MPCTRHLIALAALMLAGCGAGDDGALDVALIGNEDTVFTRGILLSDSAQTLRAATESGLLELNAQGEVVPALAETWLPTEDGLSYIFRLRDTTWPDGTPISAQSARAALVAAMARLEGTSLGRDLAPVEEVRAMAGRVIEIRLSAPEPYFLQLLAQPELALRYEDGGTGPMSFSRAEGYAAQLAFKPPEERGLPASEDWRERVRDIDLVVVDAQTAIELFDDGAVEVVLGGDLGTLPLVDVGPLSTGTLRVDATIGLFGLLPRRADGVLADAVTREALAMAIDREALIGRFNIGGWPPATRIVPALVPGVSASAPRWGDDIELRRAEARSRIGGSAPALSLALPEGTGWDMLLDELAQQWSSIGVTLRRAESTAAADLVLVDRIARYPSRRWFLDQFNCELRRGLCSGETDALIAQALGESDPERRAALTAQAEAEFTERNIFIPIAAPLRWSLVRGSVTGFEPNPWAFHPLPPMAQIPR